MDTDKICAKEANNSPVQDWNSKVTERKSDFGQHFEIITSETTVTGRREHLEDHFAILESEESVTDRRNSDPHIVAIENMGCFILDRASSNHTGYFPISDFGENVSMRRLCALDSGSDDELSFFQTFCKKIKA